MLYYWIRQSEDCDREGGANIIPEKQPIASRTEGFQAIYQEYYPKVFKQLLYLTGEKNLAEDLAQETFVKLYTAPPQRKDNLGGWLAKVAANLAYNFFRSENRRLRREEREALKHVGVVVSLEETVMRQEEVRHVRECLEKLSDRDRLILLLKFSGHSYAEIADTLNIHKNSVGKVLARVQQKFADLWSAQEEGRK